MKLKSFFTNFTKLFDNSRGFSIAEVMVAAGLMGVVSLGVMEISKQQTRVQKKATVDFDLNQLTYEMQEAMKDPKSCIRTLMAGGATPTAPSTKAAPSSLTRIVRVKADGSTVTASYTTTSRPAESEAHPENYYRYGNQTVRIISMKFRPDDPSATNPITGALQPYKLLVTFGIKNKGSNVGVPGYQYDRTTGQWPEIVVNKVLTFQAQANNAWQVLNCRGDDDADRMLNSSCDLFQGTVQGDGTGNLRCKRITVGFDTTSGTEKSLEVLGDLHSKTASITNTLLVNPSKVAGNPFLDMRAGTATISVGTNLNIIGGSLTATAATSVRLGTSASGVTMDLGNASAILNVGSGGTATLSLGSSLANLNMGTSGAATLNMGSGSAGQANISGQLAWGPGARTGLLSSDPNGAIELGSRSSGTAATPFIDFHNDGTSADNTARIINLATGLQLSAGGISYLSLAGVTGGESSLIGSQLVIPTADFTYGSNMGRAVNKDWVYNVLTTAQADNFFSTAAKDAIINQILNDATGQGNYNILRNNILDYLPTRSQMGIAGAWLADVGVNKQYIGTHCPTGYQIRATAWDSTNKRYFVECSPDCTNSAAPCGNVYVSSSLNVTGQICLNGVCKTSWGGVTCGIGRFMYGLSDKGYPMCRSIGFEP